MRRAINKYAHTKLGRLIAVFFCLLLLLSPQQVHAEQITLNLKGADITALIETVSEATGKNFVLDPKVHGKVTVVSTQPMDADALYQTFLAILEVHDFVAVPSGNIIKIIPNNTLKYRGALVPSRTTDAPEDALIIQVYPVKNVDVAPLIPVLRPLVSPKGHLAAHTDGNMLVVSDYASAVRRLGQIIRRVDQPITHEIEMVPLEHASANALANLINALQKGTSFGRPGQKDGKPLAVADDRTNSLLIGGDTLARMRLRAIIAHLDTPVRVSGNTRVVHLRFAKAEELATVLSSMGENYLKKNKQATPTEGRIVNVQVYKESNALVLTAPATLMKAMQDVIRRLDVRRAQVQVEAIIAEVNADLLANLGVEWGILAGARDGKKGVMVGTNLSNGLVGLGGALATEQADLTQEAASQLTGLLVGGTNLNDLAFLLRAIRSDASNNILSTPSLVTLDNEEAEIVVGKEVPFVTGSFSSTGTGSSTSIGSPFQTVNRKNVGLTLRVTPQINEGDTIHLELVQEASTLGDAASVNDIGMQTTNTRSIRTTVLVDNGQILVLGGLIENKTTQSTFKVPVLGDIPWLGTLFKAEKTTSFRTNLMVFLRPTILRTPQDGMILTQQKYSAIRDQQLALPTSWNPVFQGAQTPVLPDAFDGMQVVPRIYSAGTVPAAQIASPGLPSTPVPSTHASTDGAKEPGEGGRMADPASGRPTHNNPYPSSPTGPGPAYEEEADYVR